MQWLPYVLYSLFPTSLRSPVVIHVCSICFFTFLATRDTIEMTRKMAEAGAEVALVVTPCFYKNQMTVEALEKHFVKVDEKRLCCCFGVRGPQYYNDNKKLKYIDLIKWWFYLRGKNRSIGKKPSIGKKKQVSGKKPSIG